MNPVAPVPRHQRQAAVVVVRNAPLGEGYDGLALSEHRVHVLLFFRRERRGRLLGRGHANDAPTHRCRQDNGPDPLQP